MYGNHSYRVSELVRDRQRPSSRRRKTYDTIERLRNGSLPLEFMPGTRRMPGSFQLATAFYCAVVPAGVGLSPEWLLQVVLCTRPDAQRGPHLRWPGFVRLTNPHCVRH